MEWHSDCRGRIQAVLLTFVLCCFPSEILGQASQFALRFFGTGVNQQDRVRIQIDDDAPGADASAPCDVGAGNFTLEWWMRGNLADNGSKNNGGDVESSSFNWINGNIIIDRDLFGGSERDWGISIAGGFIRWGTGRGDPPSLDIDNTIEGNINVLDGNWHHVAVTRDAASGIKRIYVDAVLDFSSSPAASTTDISYPNHGAPGQATPWGSYIVLAAEKHDAGPSYPSYNGYMDELRIWNAARTQAEIAASFDRVIAYDTPGLVAYYRFEAGTGTVVADSSTAGSPNGLLIAGTPGNGEWVSYAADPNNTAPLAPGSLPLGFARTPVVTGLTEPTVIQFAPDGRLFIAERDGTIWIHQSGSVLPTPLIQIDANTLNGERGLVGMTLDPNFAATGFLYAYYTTNEPRNRVGRFTVVGNSANPAGEVLIWQNPDLAADYHHGGAITFGAPGDHHLYIATGDQFNSGHSQNLANQHGKILRVEPDGSIPTKNPPLGNPPTITAIWAYGLRNPFRITVDTPTGNLWIGDVGGNNSNSWEEINFGQAGANYGWPEQEGNVCYVSDCSAYTYPRYTYQHNDPAYYTGIVQGSISCGPVYRASQFPPGYQGNLFFGDYANRWIRRLILDAGGNVVADPLFVTSPDAGTIVDLKVGPEGALYFLTIGTPWSGNPDVGAVYRISNSGSANQPPVVMASANPIAGPQPLLVNFSSAGSFDPDGSPGPLTFAWNFGDGGTSNQPNPSHTYVNPGVFSASLTFSDGADQAASSPIAITVGMPPIGTITLPLLGTTYRAGDTINFTGTATDPEDGVLSASAFSWQVFLVHAAHTHPFLGPLKGVQGGSFVIPAAGHAPENTYYEIRLTVTDSDGLTHTSIRAITPQTAILVLDTVPSGIPIFLDGEAVNTPRAYVSLIGFQHGVAAQSLFTVGGILQAFDCWSDGGQQTHTVVMPEAGLALTAVYGQAEGQQSIEVAVGSNEWDADYFPEFGEELVNFYDPFGLCTGREASGDWQAAAAFALSIPQGAQIISARLRIRATNDQSGSPIAEIRAFDVADTAAFSSAHLHELAQHHVLTTASANWSFPAFTPGQDYDSPDLSGLVQTIVNRPDWAPGNRLGLVLDGSPSPAGAWRCFLDSTSGNAARLSVVYATQSAPTCCGMKCDDGLFCNGSETCSNGSCVPGKDPCPGQSCDESADLCVDCLTDNECNDSTACTIDTCVAGSCVSTPSDALCPDDGMFCNGGEICSMAIGCTSAGNPCNVGACDESTDSCLPTTCGTPIVAASGPRAILVNPVSGAQAVALRLTGDPKNAEVACVSAYVQADGGLASKPVFRPPLEWGTILVRSSEIRPRTLYVVQSDCGTSGNPNLSEPVEFSTWIWGDVDGTMMVDVDDLLCELGGFGGDFSTCTIEALDLMDCQVNQQIDVDDILAVLGAFIGTPYPCPPPCP